MIYCMPDEDQTDGQINNASVEPHYLYSRLSESNLHILLKQIALYELMRDGFEVIIEPDFPPDHVISWRGYRPDLLGVREQSNGRCYAVVECETHPDKTRFAKKNWREIALQSRLFEEANFTFILAVPVGKISKVTRFRDVWEIWQIDVHSKAIWKIPRIDTAATVKTQQHEKEITVEKPKMKKTSKEQ